MSRRSVAEDFESRAATFRRVALELRNPADRDALLRIAADYEQEARQIKGRPGGANDG